MEGAMVFPQLSCRDANIFRSPWRVRMFAMVFVDLNRESDYAFSLDQFCRVCEPAMLKPARERYWKPWHDHGIFRSKRATLPIDVGHSGQSR